MLPADFEGGVVVSRWTKALLAMAVVAALAMGAVAGQALAQAGPGDDEAVSRREEFLSRVAAKVGVTAGELEDAIQSTGLEMVDEAVEEGKVSPEVGERLRQRVEEGRLLPRLAESRSQALRVRVALRLVLHAAAETLDMTPRELLSEMRSSGQSLAQLAEARGVSREVLKSGILGDAEKHVGDGLDRLSENIDRIIDRSPQSPPAPTTD